MKDLTDFMILLNSFAASCVYKGYHCYCCHLEDVVIFIA